MSAQQISRIKEWRVARLATADAHGAPHVVPICYAFDGERFYSVLDQKPKRTSWVRLKRVRNILSNPEVSLVLDHYEEDWSCLWYVLVWGTAQLIHEGREQRDAVRLLRDKYDQYRAMDIDESPVIMITPSRITTWGKLG